MRRDDPLHDLGGARVALLGPFDTVREQELRAWCTARGAQLVAIDDRSVHVVVTGLRAEALRRALGTPRDRRPGERWILEDAIVPRADSLDSLVARIAGGTASADELHAFREAIAQGRSRWGRASPFAVEIVARGAADLRALELLGRRAGSCDVLEDERGRSVVRVEVERIPTAVRGRVVPAFHQFAQRAIGRKHASVWIAGWKLPPRAIVLWL